MGFFSFLKRKKGAGGGTIPPLKLDLNLPPLESAKPSPPAPEIHELSYMPPVEPSPFGQPSALKEAESYRGELASKDLSRSIELLSSKLDTIKAMLENLNHRLDKLESQKKETIRW
jgi:hypothetical protein